MAKDPAFLFYTGDFTTGTQFFSDEQVGKYVRLLLAQHQHGHLDEKHMIQICKTYDKDVFSKFSRDSEGRYYNERLEFEMDKRRKYSQSRAENRTSKKNISVTYDSHMENENSINSLNNKKDGKSKNGISSNFKARGEEILNQGYLERVEEAKRKRGKDIQG